MKHLLTGILVVSLACLYGCSSSQTNESESSQSYTSQSSLPAESSMDSNISSDMTSDESSDASSAESSEMSDASQADNKEGKSCKELADIVLNAIEFPAMAEVTDDAMLETIMDFKAEGIKDFYVYQQMMSVHLNEIIIIRSDKPDETLDMLNKRKQTMIEQLSFYPEQQESAKATVTGKKDDVCYLITHTDAKTAESALLEAI